MAKEETRDQIMVRISIENGVPRVTPLTAEEQRQFIKTHPKLKLPTFSVQEIVDGLQELNRMIDPSMISVVNDPSAR